MQNETPPPAAPEMAPEAAQGATPEEQAAQFQDFLLPQEGGSAAESLLHELGGAAQEEAEPLLDTPLTVDRFDRALVEEMREASPAWQEVETKRAEEYAEFPAVMDTLFTALWKPYPEKVPAERLSPKGKALSQILELAGTLPEWRQLREDTILDEVASAIGTSALGAVVEIPEGGPGEDPDGGPEGGQAPEGGPDPGEMRRALKQAVQQAQREVEQQRDAEAMLWGTEESGPPERKSPEERLALGKRLQADPRLRRVMELVGRFRFLARQKHRRRVKHGRDELMNLRPGSDLRDVLPQELMLLGGDAADESDLLELLFYHAYHEENLLQYEYAGVEREGRGPIVVRIDCSGSMSSALPGGSDKTPLTRMEWAVAVGLAFSVLARREKRDLNIGFFNQRMQHEWTFPGGRIEMEQFFQVASYGASGGTNYELPLESALVVLQQSAFRRADIVMVSDGECAVTPAFLERYRRAKEEKSFTAYGILIGSDTPLLGGRGTLETLTDELFQVGDLRAGEQALGAVFSM